MFSVDDMYPLCDSHKASFGKCKNSSMNWDCLNQKLSQSGCSYLTVAMLDQFMPR